MKPNREDYHHPHAEVFVTNDARHGLGSRLLWSSWGTDHNPLVLLQKHIHCDECRPNSRLAGLGPKYVDCRV